VNSSFLLILVVMFGFMYLLLIRPQRQQQRRHKLLLDNLKVGDEVITVGGIYGDVAGIEDEKVHLLIAEDVEIEVARRSIATVVPPETDVGYDEDEAADDEVPLEDELEELGRAKGAQRRRQD
jgi:preprotein translocase subunit YajC